LNLLDKAAIHTNNAYFAMAATIFYGFHTANAETVNYLISISDSFSTLCIVATLLVYQSEKLRKNYLYLIPLALGIYTKQTGLMAVPLLLIYILLFEENFTLSSKKEEWLKILIATIKKGFPAIFIGANLFLINQLFFTPDSTVSLNSDVSKFQYLYTQFFIMLHYMRNFILPTALSADPDFEIFTSFLNIRVLVGLAVIILMLAAAIWSFKERRTAPIGFGILWFYIALIPTSSVVPLYQIANDHRTFFPYIGLVISSASFIMYLIDKFHIADKKHLQRLSGVFLLLIAGHAYGTYQRNEVWNSSESLWRDVTHKSPRNGRGLMNYGLTMMSKGNFEEADKYFNKALEFTPHYSYLHINFGVLKNALGKPNEAEVHFDQALKYDPYNPECYYYYANWLKNQGRRGEAYRLLERGLQVSANHGYMRRLYDELSKIEGIENEVGTSPDTHVVTSNDEATLINLSLEYYRNGNMEACIETCERVLELNPQSILAYNNICSALNRLQRWEEALAACDKALAIDPNFNLAKNNRKWASGELKK
jgi:tetratricopeptide (TPR) repeat protein